MNTKENQNTTDRLFQVAAEVFAEHGYQNTGIREICKQAGVNQAAINYHFRTKFNFYKAVLRHAFETAGPTRPMPVLADNPRDPEGQFEEWVHWYVERLLGERAQSVVSKLIQAEMRDPTEAFELLVHESMRPRYDSLKELLAALLKRDRDDPLIQNCCLSVLGQMLIFVYGRPMLDRLKLFPDQSPDSVDAIAKHIHAYALSGILAVDKQNREKNT